MKHSLYLFLFFMISQTVVSQNDTIKKKHPVDLDLFYRQEFGVFDTIQVVQDTVYLAPLLLEQKIIVQDSVAVSAKSKGFQKVILSSFEVTRRSKNRDISYFLINQNVSMLYNRQPKANFTIPYEELSPVRTEPSYWTKQNIIGLDFNQGTFSNWNAGGFNSISGIIKGDFARKYEKGRVIWNNELKVRYGLYKQNNEETRKTDDVLSVNSTFGYKTSVQSNWYHTAKFTLNTQMADGFAYPDTEQPISRAFAPAYVFLGVGAEYALPKEGFQLYLSPATWKATYVFDERLANLGEFGLEGGIFDADGNLLKKGKTGRHEVGFLVTNQFKKTLMKNVVLEHKLTLYTDYLNNFGNIDVDWQLQLQMTVNNFIKATLGGYLIYDDDIKNKRDVDGVQITEGPRVQLKQLLGIGITFTF